MNMPSGELKSVANRIAREAMEVWETHVREGLRPLVEPHQESFSALAQSGVHLENRSVAEHLSELLRDEEEAVRKGAAETLSKIGVPTPASVEALLDCLEDEEDRQVRENAADALSKIPVTASDTIEKLSSLLREEQPRKVRQVLVSALGKIGCADSAVIEALLHRLEDDEEKTVRQLAANALGEIGEADRKVTTTLATCLGDSEVGLMSAWALEEIGVSEPIIREVLQDRLEDENLIPKMEPTDLHMALAGAERGPAPEEVVPDEPGSLLMDEVAAKPHRESSGLDRHATKDLLGRLRDENPLVRSSAAKTLGEISSSDPAVLEALVEQLRSDPARVVRESIARALGQIGVSDREVVEVLVYRLDDGYRGGPVYQAVVEALGQLAAADREVLMDLVGWLDSENPAVRSGITKAIEETSFSEPTVIGALLERLEDDEDMFVRSGAALALGGFSGSDPRVIQALVEKLEDDEAELVRCAAGKALGKLGTAEWEVSKALLDRLADDSFQVRRMASQMLRRIGTSDPAVAEALLDRIEGTNRNVCQEAARAISLLPWHFFPVRSGGELCLDIGDTLRGETEGKEVLRTDDDDYLIVHWQVLAGLSE